MGRRSKPDDAQEEVRADEQQDTKKSRLPLPLRLILWLVGLVLRLVRGVVALVLDLVGGTISGAGTLVNKTSNVARGTLKGTANVVRVSKKPKPDADSDEAAA